MALAQNPPAAERAKRGGATGGPGAVTAAIAVVVGVAVLAALQLQRGLDYWNYSEGVYAFTSRLLLRGDGIYRDVVAAQPPWQFLLGAGVLAIRDSLEALRLALGALQLATALLGAVAVWRLTASRTATVLAAPLGLLTPWAVHEHGSLTPEVVAAPLLLSAALLSTACRSTPFAAVLAAAAVFVKLPFVLALVPIVALSAAPRRAAAWALGALAVQAIAFTVLFGTGLWTDTVVAQAHVAYRGAHDAAEVLAQPVWNLAGLVVLAGVAVVRRDAARDRPLLRVLVGLAVALLLTVATVAKTGTSPNVAVPVEAVLLPLALSAVVLTARAGASRPAIAATVLGLLFTFAQTASLLAAYPTAARGAWGRVAGADEVRLAAARARRCPPRMPYSGAPYLAFVAGRRMPADQPDQFLTTRSSTLRATLARMTADGPRCP